MVAQELLKNYWSSLPPESSVCAGIPREIPTSRPYVCGNKRREFLFASLFFPYFSLSCSFPPWHRHWRTWELNHLRGAVKPDRQEQSLVGGMKMWTVWSPHDCTPGDCPDLCFVSETYNRSMTAPCVQPLGWRMEKLQKLISDLFDTSVSSELQPTSCFRWLQEEMRGETSVRQTKGLSTCGVTQLYISILAWIAHSSQRWILGKTNWIKALLLPWQ